MVDGSRKKSAMRQKMAKMIAKSKEQRAESREQKAEATINHNVSVWRGSTRRYFWK
jgi:hypothetical protein